MTSGSDCKLHTSWGYYTIGNDLNESAASFRSLFKASLPKRYCCAVWNEVKWLSRSNTTFNTIRGNGDDWLLQCMQSLPLHYCKKKEEKCRKSIKKSRMKGSVCHRKRRLDNRDSIVQWRRGPGKGCAQQRSNKESLHENCALRVIFSLHEQWSQLGGGLLGTSMLTVVAV